MWATGEWNTRNPVTSDYANKIREAARQIEISFRKVKAHSGDTFNELADKLARQAIGK